MENQAEVREWAVRFLRAIVGLEEPASSDQLNFYLHEALDGENIGKEEVLDSINAAARLFGPIHFGNASSGDANRRPRYRLRFYLQGAGKFYMQLNIEADTGRFFLPLDRIHEYRLKYHELDMYLALTQPAASPEEIFDLASSMDKTWQIAWSGCSLHA